MTNILPLCWEFLKIGLFAVGGGMAAIPFLKELSGKHPQWFSLMELADMIAVSESTPGPIGINMATYTGFKVAGVLGGVFATFALVLPSLVIVLLLARALDRYRLNSGVEAAFAALRPAVAGLIAAAGLAVLQLSVWLGGAFQWKAGILFCIVLACTQWKRLKNTHPVVFIAASAVIGIVFAF